ncbi:competence/damage-inducible protein A [Olivibacter sp. LS-1]|uniref:competence/damage-inducible protein A n=1 Tax=unclassified Olivibacter TaxID=2632301 RepID=UPI0011EAC40E|nr:MULTISPECIES: competence/damage-inducible protein A [unclassified Olivibacter]MDM8176319.1 competence/damage-inducible protein A [Olivibacter sp. 47]QEL01075.1 competence/damage-inducible protein A [Olivibacter sp. LS-1]
MTAEIITIGDEILIGQIVDTNSAWIAQQLNRIGIALVQITSIADQGDAIRQALSSATSRADIILCTGGLGPTKDDVTKQTLATYFNTTLVRDVDVLAHVESIFKKFNRPMLEVNNRQADVLANARVLHNETGTAPGMWIEENEKIYIIMPGVPTEMKYLMQNEVLPKLQGLPNQYAISHRSILTAGIGESFLAEKLHSFEEDLPPHIHLAYLPKFGQVRLRLTGSSLMEQALEKEMEAYSSTLMELVKPYFVGEGDVLLEQQLLTRLKNHQLSLSTAESCTGGYLSHLITSLPGSSAVFKGGVVSYSNELKEQVLGVRASTLAAYGAVSEQVALEMALGAQKNFKADYSMAITGIAGPDGGTDDKPVGTVWIAVAGKEGAKAKLFNFGKIRLPNIERSAANALVMLFYLLKEELVD